MKTTITIISNGPKPIVHMIFFIQEHTGDVIRFPYCRDTSTSSRIVYVETIRMARGKKQAELEECIYDISCEKLNVQPNMLRRYTRPKRKLMRRALFSYSHTSVTCTLLGQ